MDLVIWAACKLALPMDLPEKDKWENYGSTDWAYVSDEWQVIVDSGSKLELPKNLTEDKKYPHVYDVVLEPIGANENGYSLQEKVTLEIAKKMWWSHGTRS
jgi:hypothetical protein